MPAMPVPIRSVLSALVLATSLICLPGCGGGGGGGSSVTGAGSFASTAATSLSFKFKNLASSSYLASVATTLPQVQDIGVLRVRVYLTDSPESAPMKTVERVVPPYEGSIEVDAITPGLHLVSVEALGATSDVLGSSEAVVRFRAGETSKVQFLGISWVIPLDANKYVGGTILANQADAEGTTITPTYVFTRKAPYHLTDVVGITPAGKLSVDPGAQLLFDADGTVDSLGRPHPADMKIEGRLLALGTAERPVIFGRYRSETSSQRPRILFFRDRESSLPHDSISSLVRNCTIRDSLTGIELQDSDVTLSGNRFEHVTNGVVAGKSSASRVVGNVIAASSTGIFITSSATEVTRNQVSGAQYGIALQSASSLVENNTVTNASEAGIWVTSSPLCVVNSNTVRTSSVQSHWGIYVRSSNALLSQNRVERTTPAQSALLYGGIYVKDCVSGSSNTDRLVLDHNTVQRSYLANLVIAGSDPVVRFNELSLAAGGASSSGYGVVIAGLGSILPKQPLFLGNNLRNNARVAVGPDTTSTSSSKGGGVLGSAEAGGGNYVADNASVSGPDGTVRGSVDQVFDVTTPQLESVDAILSVTTSPVAGAGAPASAPKAGGI